MGVPKSETNTLPIQGSLCLEIIVMNQKQSSLLFHFNKNTV